MRPRSKNERGAPEKPVLGQRSRLKAGATAKPRRYAGSLWAGRLGLPRRGNARVRFRAEGGEEFFGWERVEHVAGFEPAAAGGFDAIFHDAKLDGGVCVGGDDDFHAALLGEAQMGVAQIEAVRIGVAFDGDAIFEDVDFAAGEQANAADGFFSFTDFFDLLHGAALVETVGDGDGFGMVGEGDVFVAEFAGGFGHLFDGMFAVGGSRVHLKVAANVGEGDELGEFFVFGGFDFAGHFAEFGFDVGEFQLRVDFFFSAGGDGFAALESGESVFVERVAHGVGAAAQDDVVFLGTGEVKESGAIAFGGDDANVDLHAIG